MWLKCVQKPRSIYNSILGYQMLENVHCVVVHTDPRYMFSYHGVGRKIKHHKARQINDLQDNGTQTDINQCIEISILNVYHHII